MMGLQTPSAAKAVDENGTVIAAVNRCHPKACEISTALVVLSSSALERVSQALDGAHVLGALEGSWIGATELAHAASQLLHGLVFVLLHPLQNPLLDTTKLPEAVAQENRAQHGYIGANHQQLDYVFGAMHTAGRGQVGADPAIKDADPGQGQA